MITVAPCGELMMYGLVCLALPEKRLIGEIVGSAGFAGVDDKKNQRQNLNIALGFSCFRPKITLKIAKVILFSSLAFILIIVGKINVQRLAPARESFVLLFVGLSCILIGCWFVSLIYNLLTN